MPTRPYEGPARGPRRRRSDRWLQPPKKKGSRLGAFPLLVSLPAFQEMPVIQNYVRPGFCIQVA